MRIALDALKGNSLNVERMGTGPTAIIAIHGFAGSAAMWDSFAAAAGNDYTVICPELPGHGKSDSPDNAALYDMKHTVQALAEIADHMGVKEAHWLGYSLGGRVALAAAASLKGRVTSLTLESASGGIDDVTERKTRKESDDALADKIEKETVEEFVAYWETRPLFHTQKNLDLSVKRSVKAARLANNTKGLANSLRGIGIGNQKPLYDKLPEFDFPCLYICGELDIKYTDIAHFMHRQTPSSHIYVAIQSGHAVHLEQPEMFNHAVLRFILMSDQMRGINQVRPGSQPNR